MAHGFNEMTRRFEILLLLIVLTNGAVVNSQPRFPLSKGNLWEYWINRTPIGLPPYYAWTSRVIGDTVMANRKTYSLLDRNISYQQASPQWLRQEGSVVYEYRGSTANDDVLFDFSKKIGDTVCVRHTGGDSSIVILVDTGTTPAYGQSRKTWVYRESWIRYVDFTMRYVVDSIGVSSLHFYDTDGLVMLHGAVIDGIQYGTLTGLQSTGVGIPKEVVLSQNFPNPFNPSTTIKYELPKSAMVRLNVFDMLGREVSVIVNERRDAGVHEVKFDGANLASGVYFYRLQAGDFTQTKRLLILK
jgi:hypothetical protein